MITYEELYEVFRKEKYSEVLQELPKKFVAEFSDYLNEMKESSDEGQQDLLSDSLHQSKKQFENAISIFKEIMLRRKKKVLNLVFIATETGIMKKDYENMLEHERAVFDKLVKAFEDGDKELNKLLRGQKDIQEEFKMVLFTQDVEEFVGHSGEAVGPFKTGELVNLDAGVAKIMVDGGKAGFVDED